MTDFQPPVVPTITFTAERSWLVDLVRDTMREHGSELLFPADEFDCCAEAVVLALRNNGVIR